VPDVEEGVGEPDNALTRATTVGLAGNSSAWPMAMSLVAMTMAMASMCVVNAWMWCHMHGGDQADNSWPPPALFSLHATTAPHMAICSNVRCHVGSRVLCGLLWMVVRM
jgi:hypothetical protein